MPDMSRFLLVLGLAVPSVFMLSYVTYRLIEKLGQSLGRIVLTHLGASSARLDGVTP